MGSASPSSSSSLVYSYPRTHSRFHLPQHQRFSLAPRSLNLQSRRLTLRCCSSASPGGPPPGENESKTVLDAFFLGKAIGEALSERIESTVGEFLSTIGRLQAEQQKQVQDFQDEVLDRAKKAKEKAARETIEAQGLVQKPATPNAGVNGTISSSPANATPAYTNSNVQDSDMESDPTEDILFGTSKED